MSLARAHGVVISGVEGHLVKVEAHLSSGLPGMSIVGLADTAVGESRDRVRAAVQNSGATWPQRRITVGLSPASLHKRGSGLDLAIASAILAADGQLPAEPLHAALVFGELGLDGQVRPVRGSVAAAIAALRAGLPRIVVAQQHAAQVGVVPGIEPVGVTSLRHWGRIVAGEPRDDWVGAGSGPPVGEGAGSGDGPGLEAASTVCVGSPTRPDMDLADVLGQPEATAAMEVAAVGGHHVAMVGRPGVGKTLIAQRLPTILPDLTDADALDVTAIRSVVCDVAGLVRRPPFEAPHHTATVAAMVGGGRGGQPTPGAVTRAHGGVLFLDEAAEFGSACLESLREPLEAGSVTVARAGFTARMPARFQLVLAANPCPCGAGDADAAQCTCSSVHRRRYRAKLSGPLMDRVDIRLELGPPALSAWREPQAGCDSATVRDRVSLARERAAQRCRRVGLPHRLNGAQPASVLRDALAPEPAAGEMLASAIARGQLSARGADRAIRVAWSLADLDAVGRPGLEQIGRALTLRGDL